MSTKIAKQKPQQTASQTKRMSWRCRAGMAAIGIAAAYGLAFLMLGKNDGIIFTQWQVYMMLMLVISMPLSRLLFQNCESLLPFGKTLGIIIPGFIMWAAGIALNIPFSRTKAMLAILMYAVINALIAFLQKMTLSDWKNNLKTCFKFEVVFFFIPDWL